MLRLNYKSGKESGYLYVITITIGCNVKYILVLVRLARQTAKIHAVYFAKKSVERRMTNDNEPEERSTW